MLGVSSAEVLLMSNIYFKKEIIHVNKQLSIYKLIQESRSGVAEGSRGFSLI